MSEYAPEHEAPVPVSTPGEDALRAQIRAEIEAEIEAETAARAKAAEDAAPEPTHYLHLADGSTVDSFGAVPTHVSSENGPTLPVIAAYER